MTTMGKESEARFLIFTVILGKNQCIFLTERLPKKYKNHVKKWSDLGKNRLSSRIHDTSFAKILGKVAVLSVKNGAVQPGAPWLIF